ncbi:hypothetical protein [Plastoroseomonas arctica]|uniref:SpoVT-AbrB domain-containing protein n=1 Tax=Plastoroseomonas arctica TaxID=1509237 RepID=A0AAF1JZ98_9PROT|nr:hypothetical protein [Plastoroseomonas arctica]MBR0654264.1 hypothetical protein [Plastoroseomonas arctica]
MDIRHYARITRKNQLSVPMEALKAVGSPPFFKIAVDGDKLVLTPAAISSLDAVHEVFRQLGLSREVIREAKAIVKRRGS